jgi:hypothetical protein
LKCFSKLLDEKRDMGLPNGWINVNYNDVRNFPESLAESRGSREVNYLPDLVIFSKSATGNRFRTWRDERRGFMPGYTIIAPRQRIRGKIENLIGSVKPAPLLSPSRLVNHETFDLF